MFLFTGKNAFIAKMKSFKQLTDGIKMWRIVFCLEDH